MLRIEIPPLREREKDVLLIAEFLMKKYAGQFGVVLKPLSLASQSLLLKHHWPGNIRELENVIQKALIISKGKLIEPGDIDLDNGSINQTDTKKLHSFTKSNKRKSGRTGNN